MAREKILKEKGCLAAALAEEAERIRLPRQVPEGSLGNSKESAHLPCLDSFSKIQRRRIKIKSE